MRKTPSLAGRAFLAVALMVGFYVLALGICVGLGYLVWADLQHGRVHGRMVLFCAITIGVVLWSLWPRRERFPDPGVRLRPEDQPELWGMVREVADAAEQAPPRALFLVGDVNAFVAERNGRMGFGGERIMGIGLPLLQTLTVPQLRSVVAHEFGHFYGGDTRLGPFIYRTRAAIGRTIVNLKKADSLMHKPFEWYGKFYLRSTFSISRAQEYAADALSVRLVGREPVLTSLRKVNEVAPFYDHYLDGEFLPVLNRRVRPPLAHGFALYLASAAMQQLQVEAGEQAMQAKGDPYDTHPPLRERLAAAADVEQPGPEAAEGPLAITLLRDLDAVEAELVAFLTNAKEIRSFPTGRWEDVIGPSVLASWTDFARANAGKLPALTVAEFADQKGEFEKHALDVDRDIPAAQRLDAGVWMLSALLARALHGAGFAIETGPGDPIVMTRGAARVDPFDTGRRVREGKLSADEWRARCAELGIAELPLAGEAAVPPEEPAAKT